MLRSYTSGVNARVVILFHLFFSFDRFDYGFFSKIFEQILTIVYIINAYLIYKLAGV